jgi:hypothetical protein
MDHVRYYRAPPRSDLLAELEECDYISKTEPGKNLGSAYGQSKYSSFRSLLSCVLIRLPLYCVMKSFNFTIRQVILREDVMDARDLVDLISSFCHLSKQISLPDPLLSEYLDFWTWLAPSYIVSTK